mmetsp:Transcript_70710/g.182306  ORF Transcript_70710/g.182306 Transcript_70710/m.182306 type:complete len:236 (+) Transcript_70710:491-1198(+)
MRRVHPGQDSAICHGCSCPIARWNITANATPVLHPPLAYPARKPHGGRLPGREPRPHLGGEEILARPEVFAREAIEAVLAQEVLEVLISPSNLHRRRVDAAGEQPGRQRNLLRGVGNGRVILRVDLRITSERVASPSCERQKLLGVAIVVVACIHAARPLAATAAAAAADVAPCSRRAHQVVVDTEVTHVLHPLPLPAGEVPLVLEAIKIHTRLLLEHGHHAGTTKVSHARLATR